MITPTHLPASIDGSYLCMGIQIIYIEITIYVITMWTIFYYQLYKSNRVAAFMSFKYNTPMSHCLTLLLPFYTILTREAQFSTEAVKGIF
jgi:hypothetical protein